MSNLKNNFLHFSLLFIQPIFMTSNIAIGKGALGFIPPISLAFWRWFVVFLFMLPFVFKEIKQKRDCIKSELFQSGNSWVHRLFNLWCISIHFRIHNYRNQYEYYLCISSNYNCPFVFGLF